MEKKISTLNCCFCNKEIDLMESHNARPITTLKGDRCCAECNEKIVIPTRINMWKTEDAFRNNNYEIADEFKNLSERLIQLYKKLTEI